MDNTAQGTAANVIVGPARLMIAPIGTSLPSFATKDLVWPGGWVEAGYTTDGTQLAYNPTIKDINVDEETAPVKRMLDAEKASISAKLAEATLTNLKHAISASILETVVATSQVIGTETLEVGSGDLAEVMVGLEGLSPAGFSRLVLGYRATSQANVQMAFKRNAETIIPVEFHLLADSTKAKGKRLFKIVDKMSDVTPS